MRHPGRGCLKKGASGPPLIFFLAMAMAAWYISFCNAIGTSQSWSAAASKLNEGVSKLPAVQMPTCWINCLLDVILFPVVNGWPALLKASAVFKTR